MSRNWWEQCATGSLALVSPAYLAPATARPTYRRRRPVSCHTWHGATLVGDDIAANDIAANDIAANDIAANDIAVGWQRMQAPGT